MRDQEWLLRCSTCKTLIASMTVGEGSWNTWESPAVIPGCHPLPSGGPGVEVVLKEQEPFEKVCRMLSDDEVPVVHTSICFKFYDGRQMWFFPGQS